MTFELMTAPMAAQWGHFWPDAQVHGPGDAGLAALGLGPSSMSSHQPQLGIQGLDPGLPQPLIPS